MNHSTDRLHEIPLVRKPTCDNCGACCMHMRSPPSVVFWEEGQPVLNTAFGSRSDPDDYAWLMAAPEEARRIHHDGVFSDRDDDAPCSWLNPATKQCRFYEFRPGICRDFELGSPECLAHRESRGIV